MHQKGKIVTWRLMALLSVLSIGFAMSSTLTHAENKAVTRTLNIWRTHTSTVGAVEVNGQCIVLPQQGVLVPIPNTIAGNNQVNVTIKNFADSGCNARSIQFHNGIYDYNGPIDDLPPCGRNCRVYMPPSQA